KSSGSRTPAIWVPIVSSFSSSFNSLPPPASAFFFVLPLSAPSHSVILPPTFVILNPLHPSIRLSIYLSRNNQTKENFLANQSFPILLTTLSRQQEMQLWGRIGPKLLGLSRYHRRRIIGDNGASWKCPLLVEARNIWSGPRPRSFLETWHRERFVPFRGFAAPVQAKPKPEAKGTEGPHINTAITAPFVRLVTDEGHTVVSRREALDRAKKLKLDLVEVQRTANPPVCKLMDFHREKYKQQIKEKERTKGKV
ncbi:Translation initiation factor IF-3, partial [Nymphaea thermarum]